MSLPISTVNIKIVADSAGVQSGVGSALSSLQNLAGGVGGGGLSGIGASIGGALGGPIGVAIGTSISNAVERVAGSITGTISTVLGLAMSAEQTSATFEALTGSAEDSERAVARLRQLGATTPISAEAYTQGAKLLLGYGVELSTTLRLQEQLGKVSAGNSERLQMLSLAMGQVAASGRLMGQDANQLAQSGFPALKLIADATGESFADVKARMEAGNVTFGEVQEALNGLTSGMGRFAEINNKIMDTAGGMWSMFKSQISELGREIGEGLLPATVRLLSVFTDMVKLVREIKLAEWIQAAVYPVEMIVKGFRMLVQNVAYVSIEIGKFVKQSFILDQVFQRVMGFSGQNLEDFGKRLSGVNAEAKKTVEALDAITEGAKKSRFDDFEKKLSGTFVDATEALVREGQRFAEQFRTPAEQFEASVRRAQELLSGGFISPETFDRAIEKFSVDLEKATTDAATKLETVKIGGFAMNTTAAFSATQEALRGSSESIKADMERAARQRDETNNRLRDILDALRQPIQFSVADV